MEARHYRTGRTRTPEMDHRKQLASELASQLHMEFRRVFAAVDAARMCEHASSTDETCTILLRRRGSIARCVNVTHMSSSVS